MNVSVLLTTYNGEKYILEQLESLKNQIMPADEVMIIDDASSDSTVKIIEAYIEKNDLSTWILKSNRENVGWKKNFFEGFKLCRGDYIFPCDQDDIWCPEKIKEMVSIMQTHKEIELLACEYEPFYERGEKLKSNRKKLFDGKLYIKKFDLRWIYINYPGCTYCFRKKFFEKLCSTWDTQYAHDALLYRSALLEDGFGVINAPLIKFRRHPHSATSQSKRSFTESDRIEALRYIEKLCDKYYKETSDEEKRRVIEKTKEASRERILYLKSPSIKKSVKLLLKYHACYNSLKGWLADNIVAIKYVAHRVK